jgi:hypothetical protein
VIFLNLVLAGLRLGLKNRQAGEKWIFDDYSYLFKIRKVIGFILKTISYSAYIFLGALVKKRIPSWVSLFNINGVIG